MTYKVLIKSSASKDIAALPEDARRRVAAKIDGLANDPRPPGCEKLAGADVSFRVRVGDYRIVYEVRDDIVTVTVVKVGHRREVYR